MKYERVVKGKFIERPNRFIAYIEINGNVEVCHVKNTGRCKELLIPGAEVYVQKSNNPARKTKFDLITVKKSDKYINIDSQAPNKIFCEWARNSGFFKDIKLLKPECKYKSSRFDCYIEYENKKAFVEVKGVTLEDSGILLFPDAPTERGVKHINELCDCVKDGYEAYVFFIVQMKEALYFTPNRETHPEFADALLKAKKTGVNIICLNCDVLPDKIEIADFVKVKL